MIKSTKTLVDSLMQDVERKKFDKRRSIRGTIKLHVTKLLKEIEKRKKEELLTQLDIAEKMGISEPTLKQILRTGLCEIPTFRKIVDKKYIDINLFRVQR